MSFGLSEDELKIAADFFVKFARFEYALKANGYAAMNHKGYIQIKWNEFASELENVFRNPPEEFREAISYYENNPPKKQIINGNNRLDWEVITVRTDSLAKKILLYMRGGPQNLDSVIRCKAAH